MKIRVQLNAIFSDDDANSILNHVESIKELVYNPVTQPSIPIVVKGDQCDTGDIIETNPSILSGVDFDAGEDTHSTIDVNGIRLDIDISFLNNNDAYDFINYIENNKHLATSDFKYCRYFECNHDEDPLIKDGPYTDIDFDGQPLIHP